MHVDEKDPRRPFVPQFVPDVSITPPNGSLCTLAYTLVILCIDIISSSIISSDIRKRSSVVPGEASAANRWLFFAY